MTTATDPATCWADPLTRKERTALARMLASACHRFYNTPAGTPGAVYSQIVASAEMSDLHLDVTERAEVPQRPTCSVCDGSGVLRVPEPDGSGLYETACPDPAHDGDVTFLDPGPVTTPLSDWDW
jgi:hypothetical protein